MSSVDIDANIWQTKLCQLIRQQSHAGGMLVAFSAGVDSTVVAALAAHALGTHRVRLGLGVSPSLAHSERAHAHQLADELGLICEEVEPREMSLDAYRRNASDRCYHCKTQLYQVLLPRAETLNMTLANGANYDDLGDVRPGMIAAKEYGVVSPLLEAGVSKQVVRVLARHMGLSNWDKPAQPCLASRIRWGVNVTSDRLQRVERAEQILRDAGLRELRVRVDTQADEGDSARIELGVEELKIVTQDQDMLNLLTARIRLAGFASVKLDPLGLRVGGANHTN